MTLQSTKTSNEQLVKKRLKEITNDVKNIEQIQEKIEKVFYETKVPEDERGVDVGDSVRLIDGTAVGRVLERKGQRFLVDFNGIKLEVNPEKLVRVKESESTKVMQQEKGTKNESVVYKPSLESNEIDIRGTTVEEAIERIDEFIDQLLMSDFSTGYIIHGKGTGKLATGIWNYLRHDKRIKNYRFGRPDEGGVGVTVIDV